jgi:hypothetical protein
MHVYCVAVKNFLLLSHWIPRGVLFLKSQERACVDCFSVDYRWQCFLFFLSFETRASHLNFMDSLLVVSI